MSEYLNRQDVLNAINDVMNDSEILHKFRALRKRINQIAVADVAEVVHGKWVYNTDDFTPKNRCSVCGYNKPIVSGENITQEPKNYCPNCGAKMDKE